MRVFIQFHPLILFLCLVGNKVISLLDNVLNLILTKSQTGIDNDNWKIHFIILFKQMLLDLGLSIKNLYDESVRKLTMNISFQIFCKCFESLFEENSLVTSYFKYKSTL